MLSPGMLLQEDQTNTENAFVQHCINDLKKIVTLLKDISSKNNHAFINHELLLILKTWNKHRHAQVEFAYKAGVEKIAALKADTRREITNRAERIRKYECGYYLNLLKEILSNMIHQLAVNQSAKFSASIDTLQQTVEALTLPATNLFNRLMLILKKYNPTAEAEINTALETKINHQVETGRKRKNIAQCNADAIRRYKLSFCKSILVEIFNSIAKELQEYIDLDIRLIDQFFDLLQSSIANDNPPTPLPDSQPVTLAPPAPTTSIPSFTHSMFSFFESETVINPDKSVWTQTEKPSAAPTNAAYDLPEIIWDEISLQTRKRY